jgi:uncharacterized protein (TIGR02246 family)
VNEHETLLIERACERLVIDSATHNDQRDWPALAALYADDGVVVRPDGQRLEGRAAIEAAYASGSPDRVTRHVCANLRVHVDGPDSAHATTVVVIVAGVRADDPDAANGVVPDERHAVGEFADRFVHTASGWRIAERRASIVMRR